MIPERCVGENTEGVGSGWINPVELLDDDLETEMSKRNRPSFEDRSHLPPSRDPDLKTDYVGMVQQVIEDQLVGLGSRLRGPLVALSDLFRSTSLLVYLVWLGSTLFPVWENASFLQSFPASLALIPILMSGLILLGSALNIPLSLDPRIPRFVWDLLLFPLPFLQNTNVSERDSRPYWTCLALWDGIILLITAFNIGHFTLGIAAPIILVMSFCSLLFR